MSTHPSDPGMSPPRPAPPFDPWRTTQVSADIIATSASLPSAIVDRQQQRLYRLLDHAGRHSRYFQRLFRGADPTRLALTDLPVTHKRPLMGAFDDWVTDPALELAALRRFTADPGQIADPFLGRYIVWESSGSTGEPAIFVQDAATMAVYDSLEALRRPHTRLHERWFDPLGLNERAVFVGALGGHFASTVSIERLRRLNPTMWRTVESLSFLLPTKELIRRLEAIDPTSIATYPTAAALLACEKHAGRLSIRPRDIWVGGENLSSAMRAYIEEVFNCPVIESYGASEFLTIATACRHGQLHLNADWVIVEAVDGEGRPVPDGTMGQTTLVTNLANFVQPVIRYDLGDRTTISHERCACGSPLPTISVHGRDDEPLSLGPEGITMLPLALTTVLEEDAGLFDFQLIRRGPSDLLLRTGQCGDGATAALSRGRDALSAFLASHGVSGVRISCRTDATLSRGKSGKIPRIVATVST